MTEKINRLKRHLKNLVTPRFKTVGVSSVAVPDDYPLERAVPKKITEVYSGRLERFDYKTIFYDVYRVSRNRIGISGPPLDNLRPFIEASRFTVERGSYSVAPELVDIDRQQRSSIHLLAETPSTNIVLSTPAFTRQIKVSPNETAAFERRSVLVTMSKNNRLEWIYDWAFYYSRHHGVDAILFYDNGSTSYNAEDVLQTLRSVPGIVVARVVKWPFKYGPHAERPRIRAYANYSQLAALNHAKDRFLSKAHMVINADVDELVVSQVPLKELLRGQSNGMLLFRGKWVEAVTDSTREPPRFEDFFVTSPARENPEGMTKWAISPKKTKGATWTVHNLSGLKTPAVMQKDAYFLHFRGISTNWREQRSGDAPDGCAEDGAIKSLLRNAFRDRPASPFV